jgi:tetratricopeptide (TPR) repeat protein
LEGYEAVGLFVQSAHRVASGLRLDEGDRPWVAQICRLLEGLPLGIELAASWLRLLSCQEIAKEIERDLRFLTTTLRDVPQRHRSLQAVFDHSWRLLSEEERQVLRRLSVFRGGLQRQAAEEVAGATLPLLSALRDKSLLRRQATGRYELHELVRQYAWQKLVESGEQDQIQDRHLDYYMHLAETAEPHLQGSESVAWLERLDADKDNLRTALAWSLTRDDSERGLRLAGALWLFWWIRGYIGEGRTWLTTLLNRGRLGPPALQAKANRAAGGLAYYQNDLAQAERCFEAALTFFREAGDKAGVGQALRNLATTWGDQGHYARAQSYAAESLALARELGDEQNISFALSNLGVLEYYLGNCSRAIGCLEEVLALDRARGDQHDVAITLHNLGEMLCAVGNYEQAADIYEESLTLFRSMESKFGQAFSLQAQGEMACKQGNHVRARTLLREGLVLFQALRETQGIGLSLAGLAALALAEGLPERAARLLGTVEMLVESNLVMMKPPERTRYQQTIATVRSQLGEATCAASQAEGRAMTLEQALAYSLSHQP